MHGMKDIVDSISIRVARLVVMEMIARRVAASRPVFEDDDYAEWFRKARFAESLWEKYFASSVDRDGYVKDGVVKKSFSFDPSEIDCKTDKNEKVKVEAAIVELRDGDDDWNKNVRNQYYRWMDKRYVSGKGEANYVYETNTIRVHIYAGDLENDARMDCDWIKDTFVHEMIHGFDGVEDRFPDNDDYGKAYPDVDPNENNGVPYPGMPNDWGRLENTDPHYGQYYSCRAERREYAYSLTTFVLKYARRNDQTVDQACDELTALIGDRGKFEQWLENADFAIDCPLVLYHLAFSDTGNGDADDARKLVELARRYLSEKLGG